MQKKGRDLSVVLECTDEETDEGKQHNGPVTPIMQRLHGGKHVCIPAYDSDFEDFEPAEKRKRQRPWEEDGDESDGADIEYQPSDDHRPFNNHIPLDTA